MSKTSKIITAIVVLLIVGGGAFYGGISYGKSQGAAASLAARASFAGTRGTRTGASGAIITSGTIIAKDSSSITLQLPSSTGGSKIILYSTATQIGKFTSGTADDLTNGTSVSVTGTTNSDGSITANSIQIRSAGQNPGGSQNPAS